MGDVDLNSSPPARSGQRVAWTVERVALWLVLFVALNFGGAWLYEQVPLRITGPVTLLQTSVPLLAALGASFILLRTLDHLPLSALGFGLERRQLRLFGLGVAIGVGALVLIVVAMLGVGWLDFRGAPGTAAGWLETVVRDFALLGVAAASEEAIFRGYAFQAMARGLGPWPAMIAGSAIFAWAHRLNPDVGTVALLNIFLAGILLSASYLLTRSLWFATAIHVGWNWAMASLADLPVSGLEILNTPLYEPRLNGPAWFTGGAFGPEGGFAGTMGFTAALVAVWWLNRSRFTKQSLESKTPSKA